MQHRSIPKWVLSSIALMACSCGSPEGNRGDPERSSSRSVTTTVADHNKQDNPSRETLNHIADHNLKIGISAGDADRIVKALGLTFMHMSMNGGGRTEFYEMRGMPDWALRIEFQRDAQFNYHVVGWTAQNQLSHRTFGDEPQ